MRKKRKIRAKKTSQPKKPLPETEWNFSKIKDEDLEACYEWEFWREAIRRSPELQSDMRNLESAEGEDQFIQNAAKAFFQNNKLLTVIQTIESIAGKSNSKTYHQHIFEAGAGGLDSSKVDASSARNASFNLFIEKKNRIFSGLYYVSRLFPNTPYLELEQEDKTRVRNWVSGLPKPSKVLRDYRKNPLRDSGAIPFQQLEKNDSCLANEDLPSDLQIEEIPEKKTYLFEVDFRFPDKDIESEFKKFLKAERKKFNFKKIKHNIGKCLEISLHGALKSLGACRLRDYHGSVKAALAVKNSRELYASRPEWSRCKERVADSILNFIVDREGFSGILGGMIEASIKSFEKVLPSTKGQVSEHPKLE